MTVPAIAALVALGFMLSPQAGLAQSDLLKSGGAVLQGLGGGTAKPPGSAASSSLSAGEIGSGLKEALRIGAERAVKTVGKPGGFLNRPDIHIPLPGPLASLRSGLAAIGASGMADDLETRINQAAEQAAPKATAIFIKAIQAMTINDARAILTGPQDSATQYFRRMTSTDLGAQMRPIIDRSLADVGAVQALNGVTAQAKSLPFASGLSVDLTGYVLDKAMSGIFLYLGREEAAIRSNPAARSTDLLKKVFG